MLIIEVATDIIHTFVSKIATDTLLKLSKSTVVAPDYIHKISQCCSLCVVFIKLTIHINHVPSESSFMGIINMHMRSISRLPGPILENQRPTTIYSPSIHIGQTVVYRELYFLAWLCMRPHCMLINFPVILLHGYTCNTLFSNLFLWELCQLSLHVGLTVDDYISDN